MSTSLYPTEGGKNLTSFHLFSEIFTKMLLSNARKQTAMIVLLEKEMIFNFTRLVYWLQLFLAIPPIQFDEVQLLWFY